MNDETKKIIEEYWNNLLKYEEEKQENKVISFEKCQILEEIIIKEDICTSEDNCEDSIYNLKCISSCLIYTVHKYFIYDIKMLIPNYHFLTYLT